MFPAKRILCPIDFSEASLQAFSNAVEIAVHNEAQIYLVYVLPVLLSSAEQPMLVQSHEYERLLRPQQHLDELAKPLLAKGLKVETVVAHGEPASEIVRIANQKAVDVIVLATHGKTGWRQLAFGSVAEKVVRTASCPVLSIRLAAHGTSGGTSD